MKVSDQQKGARADAEWARRREHAKARKDPQHPKHTEALHYIEFWLNSINIHATKSGATAPEEKYPPVVLIGTRLDELPSDGQNSLPTPHLV